jgi:hypothetical protein
MAELTLKRPAVLLTGAMRKHSEGTIGCGAIVWATPLPHDCP